MTRHLTPDRYQQRDFFVGDLCDIAAKDGLASMEHPLFALKAGDRRPPQRTCSRLASPYRDDSG